MKRAANYSKAAVLSRGIDVLLVIKNTGVATSQDVKNQALPKLSLRSVQRYLGGLIEMGLIYKLGEDGVEYRYFLTGKAKQLFGATDTQITGN